MTVPDPDKDILDKLDRREERRKILPGVAAFAGGCAAGLAAYEIMKWVFRWIAPAPLYGGAGCLRWDRNLVIREVE